MVLICKNFSEWFAALWSMGPWGREVSWICLQVLQHAWKYSKIICPLAIGRKHDVNHSCQQSWDLYTLTVLVGEALTKAQPNHQTTCNAILSPSIHSHYSVTCLFCYSLIDCSLAVRYPSSADMQREESWNRFWSYLPGISMHVSKFYDLKQPHTVLYLEDIYTMNLHICSQRKQQFAPYSCCSD